MKQILLALSILVLSSGTIGNLLAQESSINVSPISSPKKARDDARKIAVKFADRGYQIHPVGKGSNFEGTQLIFQIELIKGMDYIIMVGIDDAMPAVDLYVKSEGGNMIAQDTRNLTRAVVEFSSDYNGVCEVIVKPVPSEVIGHFAVLVGYQPGF